MIIIEERVKVQQVVITIIMVLQMVETIMEDQLLNHYHLFQIKVVEVVEVVHQVMETIMADQLLNPYPLFRVKVVEVVMAVRQMVEIMVVEVQINHQNHQWIFQMMLFMLNLNSTLQKILINLLLQKFIVNMKKLNMQLLKA